VPSPLFVKRACLTTLRCLRYSTVIYTYNSVLDLKVQMYTTVILIPSMWLWNLKSYCKGRILYLTDGGSKRNGEKYIMNCIVIILCLKYYQKGRITENEMGNARSTHESERGRRKWNSCEIWFEYVYVSYHFRDQVVFGRIILKWLLQKGWMNCVLDLVVTEEWWVLTDTALGVRFS